MHHRTLRNILKRAVLVLAATSPLLASAWELDGSKALTVHTRDGQHIALGRVIFEPREAGRVGFKLALNPALLHDHFLSMKEFKCLEGPDELACHVPYPYKQPGTVGVDDYAWLEHSLLFMFKQPRDFGAKLWNGLYFKLERGEKGLIGRPQAVDLNHISAPPDRLDLPPFDAGERSDIQAGARWISSISID